MKITVPAITFETVGWRYVQSTRYHYYAAHRPNVVPRPIRSAIREPRLTTAVVLDRDLRVAHRAKHAARLVALTAITPFLVSYTFVAALTRPLVDAVRDAADDAGVVGAYAVKVARLITNEVVR